MQSIPMKLISNHDLYIKLFFCYADNHGGIKFQNTSLITLYNKIVSFPDQIQAWKASPTIHLQCGSKWFLVGYVLDYIVGLLWHLLCYQTENSTEDNTDFNITFVIIILDTNTFYLVVVVYLDKVIFCWYSSRNILY